MRWKRVVKNAAFVIALCAALLLSFAFYIGVAVDYAPGKHAPRPGLLFLAVVVLAWLVVGGLSHWRNKH